MKRLIVTAPRQVEFEEVPVPVCGPGELLIQARLTAVSAGTELRVYRAIPVDEKGEFLHERIPFQLPAENGYSMVGEVAQIGDDVKGFEIGNRVFAAASHKQFAVVSAAAAVKLPVGVSDEQAVFLNILEVAHIALRRGNPQPGANIAVVGQGVIGLSAVAFSTLFGMRTVAVDPDQSRLDIARSMGADLAISPSDDGFVETVMGFLDHLGADVVLEATSSWRGVETGMQIAKTEARVVIVSRHTKTPHFNPAGHPFLGKRLELVTSYGYPPPGNRWDQSRSRNLTLRLLEEQQLQIELMLTHRFSWEQLPDVYRQFDAAAEGLVGAVIEW